MFTLIRKNLSIVLPFVILVLVGIGFFTYYKSGMLSQQCSMAAYPDADIRTCTTQEEENFVRKQFRENWSILISSPDYDIDYFLKERGIYRHQPQHKGNMQIKVLYKEKKPVGFIAYYMKSDIEGTVFLLAIDKDHRGKRYADDLVNYAKVDLTARGALYMTIGTSKTNENAQKLYTRLGYKRVEECDPYVEFRKMLR